jgi:hypothetical protein
MSLYRVRVNSRGHLATPYLPFDHAINLAKAASQSGHRCKAQYRVLCPWRVMQFQCQEIGRENPTRP